MSGAAWGSQQENGGCVWRYVPLMLQKSGYTSEDDHMEHENPGRLTAGSPENTGPPRSSENHSTPNPHLQVPAGVIMEVWFRSFSFLNG